MGGVFEFYLESVALHPDGIQIYGLKNFARVADKSCRAVKYSESKDRAYIDGSTIGNQDSSHRPVYHIDSVAVTGAYRHVCATFDTGCKQSWQIGRIV